MSPEVALLVRAALLGLLVFTLERFGKRRQVRQAVKRSVRRAEAERTIVRLPPTLYADYADEPPTSRPLQVTARRRPNASTVSAPAQPGQAKIVQLEPTPAPKLYDGYVTEKRAA